MMMETKEDALQIALALMQVMNVQGEALRQHLNVPSFVGMVLSMDQRLVTQEHLKDAIQLVLDLSMGTVAQEEVKLLQQYASK